MPSPPPASPGKPRPRASGSARRLVLPLVPGLDRPPARRRPLPDAAAVRLVVVPDSAPPYDDEQGVRVPARHLTAVAGPGATGGRTAAAGPRAQDGAAAPPGWPSQFAQVLAETLAGSRPQRQIAPWTTERARRHIRRLGPLLAAGQQPRVRRVVTFRPATDVVEMTVIVGVGSRVRALAVRLERDGPHRASPGRDAQAARWVAVAVEAA